MAGRLATIAAWSAAMVLAREAPASAQETPASPIRVAWAAPDGCPQGKAVEAEITRLLGAPPRASGGRKLEVDGSVTPSGSGYALDLATRDEHGALGRRTISGASCGALADAAALVVALGWDPDAVAATRSAPPTAPAPPAPPTPPAPLVPPTPVVPPALPAPPAPPGPSPPLPSPRVTPPVAAKSDPLVELGIGVVVDSGGLPGVSPGLEGRGELLLGPWRLGARLVGFPSSESALDEAATRGGRFSQVFGVASVGRAVAPWRGGGAESEVAVALGLEAGATFASGFGVDNPKDAAVPWVAPRLVVDGRLGLVGGVGLRGEAGAAVPLVQRDFLLDQLGVLHTPSPVALRLAAGIDVRF